MSNATPTLSPTFVDTMAEVLRVLAHGYRLRIVEYLDLQGPSPVFAIAAALGGPQGALSQHLNKMRAAGLLRSERRGKEVWYAIANPDSLTILNCMRKRCEIHNPAQPETKSNVELRNSGRES